MSDITIELSKLQLERITDGESVAFISLNEVNKIYRVVGPKFVKRGDVVGAINISFPNATTVELTDADLCSIINGDGAIVEVDGKVIGLVQRKEKINNEFE